MRPMNSPMVCPLMNSRRQHRDNILVGTHQASTQRKPLIPDTSYILLRQLFLEENEPLGRIMSYLTSYGETGVNKEVDHKRLPITCSNIDHADDNDIRATTKEPVDEVGRTLFFGKTLGAEPKAIG
ncbi:hypothetical protein SASPL_150176 [Salvia splendens]|uniref:Uncharacterized protein n=1 Tax=Salvia splendens TaxID=180675 RepID=A0A8X8W6E0_SALSN|nr:hypothetical protein SASPL_150176 [Salvia splendens]